MNLIVRLSSDVGDVIWEPFGGLFTGSLAANELGRDSYAAEIDKRYFEIGKSRLGEYQWE